MNLTDKQKKWAWIAGAALLAIHFAPNFINTVRHAFSAPAVIQKSSAAHIAPVAPPPPPPTPEMVAAAKYGGIWEGNALMPDQMRCGIRLEIRLSDDLPKKLKGYESKKCIPLQPLAGGKPIHGTIADVIVRTSPTSAVMTGNALEGGIRFTIDQTIGTPGEDCGDLSGFTITDFGQGQVIAQWQEGTTCPAGKMTLTKARG
jgi:hypothetical protein